VTVLARAAGIVAADPGPAVHLAALGIVLLVGLATYGVVRWRRRRDNPQAKPKAHDHTSAHPRSKTPRP
jgi:membrane protein implicated in regulation of membrane protease activity